MLGRKAPNVRMRRSRESVLPARGSCPQTERYYVGCPTVFARTSTRGLDRKTLTPEFRHRSIQAEGKALSFERCKILSGTSEELSVALAFDPKSRTYRLNRGPEHEEGEMGFDVREGSQRITWGWRTYELQQQAVSAEDRLREDGSPVRCFR